MKYLIKKPDTFLNVLNDDINAIVQRSFDNLFPEYIFEQEVKGIAMPVDVKEYEDKYCLCVELPGIDKNDITIDVNKSGIKIEANKSCEKEEKAHKYHKSEFRYGNYSRTLYFPYEIDTKKSSAELKKGILKIVLPKMQPDNNQKIRLEIKD